MRLEFRGGSLGGRVGWSGRHQWDRDVFELVRVGPSALASLLLIPPRLGVSGRLLPVGRKNLLRFRGYRLQGADIVQSLAGSDRGGYLDHIREESIWGIVENVRLGGCRH